VLRETYVQAERVDRLLLHLFQHQIHHRGQAHAMLSGTKVPPPQLDEFFSTAEGPLRAAELEEGLEQDFNSLHAQREACEAFIKSQQGEGWRLVKRAYDDGGLSGGTMERPALQRLLDDIREGHVDVVVVYKVDRLTRSLADFAKMVEVFDARGVSFVAVTQQFNTTTSMGRLTLNVLLSFAHLSARLPANVFATR
jgi:hypothetical protein